MFYAVSFANRGLPLIAYCTWNESTKKFYLAIASSGEHVAILLAKNNEGQDELVKLVSSVPEHSHQELVEMTGAAAASSGNFIIALINDGVSIEVDTDMVGFWGPPPGVESGNGILVWTDPENQPHAVVVYSKEQAKALIKECSRWMERSRVSNLMEKVKSWNIPPSSEKPPQRIEGLPAKLLNEASLYGKIRNAQQRYVN